MKRIIILVLCIFTLMSFKVVPTLALTNDEVGMFVLNQKADIVVVPNAVCIEEFGCVVKSYGSVIFPVPLFKQSTSNNPEALPAQTLGASTPWKNNPLYRTGKTTSQCGITETIGSVGCHLVSFSMVISYFSGFNQFPDVVNNKIGLDSTPGITTDAVGLGMTCLFDPVAFTNFYSNTMVYDSVKSQTGKAYKSISDVAFIEPYIRSGEIVIVFGRNTTGGTHFVVVKGVDGSRTVYDSGYVDVHVNNFTINDPGANRLTLSDFLVDYQTITAVYVFRGK